MQRIRQIGVPKRALQQPARLDDVALAPIELVPALLSLETILVPTDFSKESKKALRYAYLRLSQRLLVAQDSTHIWWQRQYLVQTKI